LFNPKIREFPYLIFDCTSLEELNLVQMGIKGKMNTDLLKLNRLRHLNLAENLISGGIPKGEGWKQWTKLQTIEL
jgi:hypothetical protein